VTYCIFTNWGKRGWRAASGKEGIWVGGKLNTTQQRALAAKRANSVLGCIKHSIASQLQEAIVPLYTAVVQPHLKYSVQFWVPQCKKDIKLLRVCPEEGDQDGERP